MAKKLNYRELAGSDYKDLTEVKRLPKKDTSPAILKKVGISEPYDAVIVDFVFRSVDEFGHDGFFKHGDFLIKNHKDMPGPKLFAMSKRDLGSRWIEY